MSPSEQSGWKKKGGGGFSSSKRCVESVIIRDGKQCAFISCLSLFISVNKPTGILITVSLLLLLLLCIFSMGLQCKSGGREDKGEKKKDDTNASCDFSHPPPPITLLHFRRRRLLCPGRRVGLVGKGGGGWGASARACTWL